MRKSAKNFLVAAAGAAIGLINGFFGGGGGMLCVPALESLMQKPVKKSHATAILVILPISAASAGIYIAGGHFPLESGLYACAGVLAGGIAGAFLLKRLSGGVLTLIFSLVMIAAGIKQFF